MAPSIHCLSMWLIDNCVYWKICPMLSIMVLCVMAPVLLSINSAIDHCINTLQRLPSLENEDTLATKQSNAMLRERSLIKITCCWFHLYKVQNRKKIGVRFGRKLVDKEVTMKRNHENSCGAGNVLFFGWMVITWKPLLFQNSSICTYATCQLLFMYVFLKIKQSDSC